MLRDRLIGKSENQRKVIIKVCPIVKIVNRKSGNCKKVLKSNQPKLSLRLTGWLPLYYWNMGLKTIK